MRVGYPCINRGIGCRAGSTFRLASYSRDRLRRTVSDNLDCLEKILRFNQKNGLLFFRISSDLIPFASHPVCDLDWATEFGERFLTIGRYVTECGMRISMHPDQFTLINSPREDVLERSVEELRYHVRVLEAMGLNRDTKVQIHVGGAYGNKEQSICRFLSRYEKLPEEIRKHLVIENDERLYCLQDCLLIHEKVGVPVLFDSFHHQCFHSGESLREGMSMAKDSWKEDDGVLMVDYSSQRQGDRPGKHAETINASLFHRFLEETDGVEYDLMLEIKDKESSALRALELIRSRSGNF